jgi:multidrug efflux system outer membrane protein
MAGVDSKIMAKRSTLTLHVQRIGGAVAAIAGLLFTGCMVGPDFQTPSVDTPAQFRFADPELVATVNLKWWELFDDPTLEALVVTALRENKDVLIAASRVEEARASLGFTRADMYPTLDLQAGASRGDFAGGRKSDSVDNNAFIAPTLNWEIDFWGKFRRANEAARADLVASEYAMRTVQIGLIAEVVSTYYLLLDLHQRMEISRQTLESRIETLDIIQQRFDKGIVPELDVNQAQIQKEVAASAIPLYKRLIASTEHTLSILVGTPPRGIETGVALYQQQKPPAIPSGLPSSLLERRPDVLAAQYSLKSQTERIGVAEALRFPAISLTGSAGGASTELTNMTIEGFAWSIGANLVGPVYNFGKNKKRVEIEKARTKQALYRYESTVLVAFREVADALNEIQTYGEQIASVRRRYEAAKNADTLAKLRYDKGFSDYLLVLETERTLFSVGLELSELTKDYYNAYVRLYKALGGGWISREAMESQDEDRH